MNSTLLWYLRLTCFCLLFRRNWRHQKEISKCLFGVFNFFQKTNKNKSTWGIIVVKSNRFIVFRKKCRLKKTTLSDLYQNDVHTFLMDGPYSFFPVFTSTTRKCVDWSFSSTKMPKFGYFFLTDSFRFFENHDFFHK